MAEFVVNVMLIGALLLLVVIWAVSATRSRRRSRRERAAERHLILSAFTNAGAAQASLATGESEVPATSPERPSAHPNTGPLPAAQSLDSAAVGALLDLLEDRRPARHGLVAGLFTSPRRVWSAGANAGHNVARRTMGERERAGPAGAADAQLCRHAAAELVDIHAHSPTDARAQYSRYAAALPDPALADLYVRSAAYATYADHDQVLDVVASITTTAPPGSCEHRHVIEVELPPKVDAYLVRARPAGSPARR